jgi:hypothetical protein
MAMEFQRRGFGRHPSPPEVTDYPAWWSLMRHYGLPTCHLDWSQSILVAAFFAAWERETEGLDGTIWCLNPGRLNQLELGLSSPMIATSYDPRISEIFEDVLKGADGQSDSIVAILPHECDIRMLAQQSVFTMHRSSTPLEAKHERSDVLLRFTIPAAAKKGVRGALLLAGLRRSSLFPDLQNLAQEIIEDFQFTPFAQTRSE